MSHLGNNELIDFEADNFQDLAEHFVRLKGIEEKWADFVLQEYTDQMADREDDDWHPEDDNKEPNPEDR